MLQRGRVIRLVANSAAGIELGSLSPMAASMKRRILFWVITLSFVGASQAHADSSVYRVSPWWDGGGILATSLASLIPAINARHLIHPRCPCDPGEVNGLDRHVIGNESHAAEVISDVTLGLSLGLPPLLDWQDLGSSSELAEDLTIYAEALSVSGAFVTLAKFTVQRPIPRLYAGQSPELLQDPSGYGSFYSGHVNLTVAALSAASVTVNLRHHWGVWPLVVTGALGVSVAAERVLAGRHFYTDVAMGAVSGAVFGVVVPWLHQVGTPEQTFSLSPVADGVQVGWTRQF